MDSKKVFLWDKVIESSPGHALFRFVSFDGGTYLAPVIGEVIMYGRDTKTGDLLSEDIKH